MSQRSNRAEMPEEQTRAFLVSDIETLVRGLESLSDATVRALAAELLRKVLSFHEVGLEHILKRLAQTEFGERFVEELTRDPTVSNLLLLHGLHPISIEKRVRAELEEVAPYWKSAGYELKSLEIADGNLHLQFHRRGAGTGPALALKSLVQNAVVNAAPDVDHLTIEGLEADQQLPLAGFVPLKNLLKFSSRELLTNGGRHNQ
jgi:hypothetical protein